VAGPQKRTRLMSEHEKKITAYHEGGHALVAHALPNTDPVHKVTILPRGRAASTGRSASRRPTSSAATRSSRCTRAASRWPRTWT